MIMPGSASLFIVAFTIINIAACGWLMWWTARDRSASESEHTPAVDAQGEKTGHVWDGDLEEYNNPLPRWWLGLFIITILFAIAYLAVFPGLGNFGGLRGWNQIDQYDKQIAAAREKLEVRLASVKDQPLAQLARDGSAMSTAKNLFGANCSTCHGSDARGAKGFPNLTDADWLYGGDPDTIYATIANGRHGIMPALGSALGDNGVNEVASYVVSLSGGKAPEDWVAAGKQHFAMMCAACHGIDAQGNTALGAPNLTDDVWLHGRDFDSIRATITSGRDNQMPAHLELLGEVKVKLLAAYVMSLSADDRPQATDDSQREVVSDINPADVIDKTSAFHPGELPNAAPPRPTAAISSGQSAGS